MHKKFKILSIIITVLLFAGSSQATTNSGKNLNAAVSERKITSQINKNPDDIDASLKLIKFFLDNDEDTRARIEINRIQSKAGGSAKFFIVSAKLLFKKGLLDDAEEMAKKAVKISYNNPDAFIMLGNIYFEKLNSLQNTPDNEEIKKNYLKKAFDDFYTAYKYDSTSPFAHIGLANAYYMNNQASLANDEILKVKELCGDNAEALYLIGEYYYKTKDYAKSKIYLEKSISAGLSSKYKTYYLLGTIYEQNGDVESSQKNYLKVLKLKPNHAQSQQNLDRLIKITYKEAEAASSTKKTTADLFSNLNDELNSVMQADYFLIIDEFTRARELYIKVLDKNPDNVNAISGLAELYFAKWAEGFTNSTDFVNDSKFILKTKENPRIVIPFTKFNLINEDKMPEKVRQKFISLSVSETFDFYDLLNEVRSEFLLGNYEESHRKLEKLLALKLSNYEKFKVLKSLCYDHDYDEALILIKEIKKTYYHNDELEPIVNRINTKLSVADEKLNQAINLFSSKQPDFASAEYIINQAIRYFPTSKKAYINYAYLLEKQKRYKEAIEKAHVYYRLYILYPDNASVMAESDIRKYIQTLNKKLAESESKK